jgi:predicted TIM-barrel fold metal-dependent hydrolase
MALALDNLRVIDADTHLTEPADLWTKRAPAEYRDRVPRIVEIDGIPNWVADGNVVGFASGGGVIDRNGKKGRALKALYEWTIDEVHVAAADPKARIGYMDESGIWAEVLFPNNTGGQILSSAIDDPNLRLLCFQIYNDAMAEFQSESGNRLIPMAVLPTWDVDASVREAERIAELGLRGITMTADPQDQGVPDLANAAWDPLWEVCSDNSQLPVHFHIGASGNTAHTFFGNYPWASQHEDSKMAIGGTLLFVGTSRVVVNIIVSGMLERHPGLKMVQVESGVGWIPCILEALDFEMSENAPEQLQKLSMRPSEYFKRQMYVTYWFEKSNIRAIIDTVGPDNILFETDFPHPTCLYPNPLDLVADKMETLTPEVQRKILGENAARLYRV